MRSTAPVGAAAGSAFSTVLPGRLRLHQGLDLLAEGVVEGFRVPLHGQGVAALLEATGGWPTLLNRMLALALKGFTPRKAFAQLAEELEGVEGARLLEATGLTDAVELHSLVDQLVDFDEPLPMEDLTDLLRSVHFEVDLQLTALRRLNVLDHAGPQGLAIEPVIAAAWRRHAPR
ncbi:hypothetical protein [Streptomyces sp. NPDC023588]|uniref:hypothetical protein n=1 Tax=Streptomyces sp. NPDC023588 TaxID=3154907 RepID=UPI0033D14EB6